MPDYRYYQDRGLRALMRTAGYGGAVATSLIVLLSSTSPDGTGRLVLAAGCVLFLCLTGYLVERVWIRGGLEELPDVLVDHGSFGNQRFFWREIEAFEAGHVGIAPRLFLTTVDGRRFMLVGATPGRRAQWDGGETRDIAAVLNERLPMLRDAAARGSVAGPKP